MKLGFLNKWRSYILIFLPILLVVIFYNIPLYENGLSYGLRQAILFFVFEFTLALLYFFQIYLGIRFYKQINKKSYLFLINGFVPMIFWVTACLWLLYCLPLYLKIGPTKQDMTPDNPLGFNLILAFLIHYLVTFFVINKLFVRFELKKINDPNQEQELRTEFYSPINKMIISTSIIFLLILIYSFIYFILTH